MTFKKFRTFPHFKELYEITTDDPLPSCNCRQCSYYTQWISIMRYNLWVGTVAPVLWIINVVISGNALVKRRCSHHTAFTTILGHLVCALLLCLTFAVGAVVFWRNVRV